MSILAAEFIHRPLEPLSETNLNLVNMTSSSSSSQSSTIILNDSLKRNNGVVHETNGNGNGTTKRKGEDSLEGVEGEPKKQKKRVDLINENGNKDENTSPSSKKDEKRKEKEAREEEKRKEKETKEEERRKEKELKEEEKRKEKESKEEERKKEKELKDEEKRKEKEARDAKEEERRKDREAKEEVRIAKRKEREAKEAEKAQKEAEKEAKRAKEVLLQKRSANLMSNFVVQRPSNVNSSPVKSSEQVEEEISDFNKTFLPCPIKNMAPVNRFHHKISHDAFDSSLSNNDLNNKDLLQGFLSQNKKSSDSLQKRRSRKGIRAPVSVRESMRLITEAGVLGDDRLLEENGKKGIANLTDRKRLPIKLLHFASDRRPAWYGTWTRSSNFVSARKPLAQDPVALDYSYDSDAEWEDFDPMEGDDLNDNDEKDDEDHCSRTDSDSEMDDWLVDDLEVEEEEEEEEDLDNQKGKRAISRTSESPLKAAITKLEVRKKPKKFKTIGRRFETKLVKFETGPHWEEVLGVPSYDGFKAYQMEMLNDTYPGINPFTFTSSCFAEVDGSSTAVTSVKSEQIQSANTSPASTRTTATSISTSEDANSKSNLPSTINGVSEAVLTKAKMFPEENLKELLVCVEGNSSIKPILLEELRVKFASLGKTGVPKNTLEACLTTYAEKQTKKAGGKWVIKSDYRSLAGL